MEGPARTPGRAFCPECGQKYAVPEKELQRRPGVRFSATCRSCATRFSVRWENGDLVTEADEILTEDHDERHVFAKGARIDKYEIEEAVASGGSSTVYRAFDSGANRTVALKVLHQTDSEYLMRFRREVEVQGNLKHPNLMPIFDHGIVDGKPYYTMELLHKPMTLDTVIGLFRNRRLSYHPVLKKLNSLAAFVRLVVLPAARAIAFANRNGVIHRDLKPGNVIIDGKTLHVYVIDFGICHLFRKTGSRIVLRASDAQIEEEEKKLMTMGTLRCMPPEQARGGVTEQGDVWSLGALLYHLLAGDAPIPPAIDLGRVSLDKRMANLAKLVSSSRAAGDEEEATFYEAKLEELRSGAHRTMKDLLRDALHGNYTPMPEGVDPQLKAIVERAMQVDPRQRYSSVDDLAADLQNWLDGRPVRAYTGALRPLRRTVYRASLFSRRNRNVLGTAAIVLALLGVAAGLWRFRAKSEEERNIKEWLFEAQHTMNPAVQEDRLGQILARRPGYAEAERMLATVRRFKPLLAQVEAARALHKEISEARAHGLVAEVRRRAGELDDMAAILEVVARELAALPEDYPGRALEGEARQLVHYLRARRTVELTNVPVGTKVALVSTDSRLSRDLRWNDAEDWGTAPLPVPQRFVDPGSHVLMFSKPGGYTVYLPFLTDHLTPPSLRITCPMDPADLPPGMVFIAGAQHMEFGDLRFSEETTVTDVAPFYLDQYEVTNTEYAKYIESLEPEARERAVPREILTGPGSRTRPLWNEVDGSWVVPEGAGDLPVTGISYFDARNYAWWAGKRLPTVDEWELSARGVDGRDYSFGKALDRTACNAQTGTVAAVGSFPRDRSPYGVYDLAGNVAEWVESGEGEMAVTKGGSFEMPRYHAMATAHDRRRADLPYNDTGFRCAKDLPK